MAIVRCPGCRKQFSSVGGNCPHCGVDPAAVSRRGRKPAAIGPGTHYLLAMAAALGGAGWFYSALAAGTSTVYAKWLIGIGIIWYVAARIWGALRR